MRRLFPLVLALGGCVEPDLGIADQAVIGASPTAAGMYPAVGALYRDGAVTCTGTLIAPDAVLTAAHCLRAGQPLPGFTFDTDTRGAVTVIPAASAVVHPMWNIDRPIGDGPTQYYDIGVLLLTDQINDVRPMILASAAEGAALVDGKLVTMVGYGQTVDGDAASAGVKSDAQAPIVDTSPSELQVSNPGQPQNCYGDSGGPAVADLGAGARLVGVVSRGATAATTCDQGGVDTRVDYYATWVRQQVGAACIGGQRCAGGTIDPGDPGYGAEIEGGCGDAGGGGAGGGVLVLVALVWRGRRRRLIA
ncbi:MAG: trypsin-like serine protease [Kofleriaceae bacterium]